MMFSLLLTCSSFLVFCCLVLGNTDSQSRQLVYTSCGVTWQLLRPQSVPTIELTSYDLSHHPDCEATLIKYASLFDKVRVQTVYGGNHSEAFFLAATHVDLINLDGVLLPNFLSALTSAKSRIANVAFGLWAKVPDTSVSALFDALYAARVGTLQFSRNIADGPSITQLSALIARPKNTLKSLTLSQQSFDVNPESFQALGTALTSENCVVKELTIRYSNLQASQMPILTLALTNPANYIRVLDISNNGAIGIKGLENLRPGLSYNKLNLDTISLTYIGINGMETRTLRTLERELSRSNPNIVNIQMRGEKWGKNGLPFLHKLIQTRVVKSFGISDLRSELLEIANVEGSRGSWFNRIERLPNFKYLVTLDMGFVNAAAWTIQSINAQESERVHRFGLNVLLESPRNNIQSLRLVGRDIPIDSLKHPNNKVQNLVMTNIRHLVQLTDELPVLFKSPNFKLRTLESEFTSDFSELAAVLVAENRRSGRNITFIGRFSADYYKTLQYVL